MDAYRFSGGTAVVTGAASASAASAVAASSERSTT